jgi:hypothetical protein
MRELRETTTKPDGCHGLNYTKNAELFGPIFRIIASTLQRFEDQLDFLACTAQYCGRQLRP